MGASPSSDILHLLISSLCKCLRSLGINCKFKKERENNLFGMK